MNNSKISIRPAEATLSERDSRYLRDAIALSATARQRGNGVFGSVIVAADDEMLSEAWNNAGETGDCTGHAETNAIRKLDKRGIPRERLAGATLYASGEPCVMCAGAIFWAGIGRVVFGVDAERLRTFPGAPADGRKVDVSCRDVFDAATPVIECVGPALIEEASAPHMAA